jgi:hypothetical protein
MYSHLADRGEQMIRYYGYYSAISRGKRKKKRRPPLKIHFPTAELYTDYSDSQIPPWDNGQTSGSYTHILYLPSAH